MCQHSASSAEHLLPKFKEVWGWSRASLSHNGGGGSMHQQQLAQQGTTKEAVDGGSAIQACSGHLCA